MKEKNMYLKLIPVMLTFFTMGFVDLVGIATNYVKEDFQLSDTLANLFPSMVFIWFLVCSVPTGMLMNRIGRRKTVLISLVITVVSLILPSFSYSFVSMLLSFSLLGIGNAIMQVSLNPLLSNIVSDKRLASSLTLGQFVKAIASFLAPIIAAWAAVSLNDWKYLYPIFMGIAVIAVVLLGMTQIKEQEENGRTSTFAECFALLGDKLILLSFIGIICHVGLDVGINVTAPKILIERLGMDLSTAGYATSLYFLFRTIGSFTGAFALAKVSPKLFYIISVGCILAGIAGLLVFRTLMPIYVSIALFGFGNSNLFAIILSQAMFHIPERKNEVSALMIMGLFGGTIFPLLMGIMSDAMGTQTGALLILIIGAGYMLFLSSQVKR